MNLHNDTVKALSLFQKINERIVIHPGNVLKTLSESGDVYAEAIIPDSFPETIGVWDLKQLISIIEMHKPATDRKDGLTGSHLEFSGKSFFTIHQDKTRIKFYKCAQNLIKHPPADYCMEDTDPYIAFHMDPQLQVKVRRAATIVGQKYITIEGDGSQLWITACDPDNPESVNISTEIGDTDKKFRCVLAIEMFNLLSDDLPYFVQIHQEGQVHFAAENFNLYVGMCSESEFE